VADPNNPMLPKSEGKSEAQKMQEMGQLAVKIAGLLVVLGVLAIGGWLVWKLYFDKAGQVVWRQPIEGSFLSTDIIGVHNDRIWAVTAEGLQALDPASGEVVQRIGLPKFEDPAGGGEIEDHVRHAEFHDGGFIIYGSRSVARLNGDGKVQVAIALPFSMPYAVEQAVNEDRTLIAGIEKEPLDPERPWITRDVLRVYDLTTGEPTFPPRKLKPEHSFGEVAVGPAHVVTTIGTAAGTRMVAFDARSGKGLWQRELPARGVLGIFPRIERGVLIYQAGNQLHGLTMDNEPAWGTGVNGDPVTIEIPAELMADLYFRDGYFIVVTEEGSMWYDLNTGQPDFRTRVAVDEESIFMGDQYIVLRGTVSKQVKGAISGIPGASQVPGIEEDFQFANNMSKSESVLVCLDADSKEQLWSSTTVPGTVLTDGERLVRVMTSEESMMRMISQRQDRQTYLFQYRLSGGQRMIETTLDGLMLSDPVLAGRYVIGFQLKAEQGNITENDVLSGEIVALQLR